MKRNLIPTVVICLIIMSISLSLFVNKVVTPKNMTTEDYKELGVYLKDPPRTLDGFKLVDTHKSPFLPQDFSGSWNVVFFGFTYCPDICPITMHQLGKVETRFQEKEIKKIKFYFVTVDPDRDSIDIIKKYLSNFSENFVGLTGTLDQIYKFSTQVNSPFDPVSNSQYSSYSVTHSGNIVLINPEGLFAGLFKAPHDEEKILKVLNELLKMKE